jgi:hypothetical protein
MSLRMNCVIEGYGPSVSDGDTAQAAAPVVGVVGVVVDDVVTSVGLIGVSPPHAAAIVAPTVPSTPRASRLVNFDFIMRAHRATAMPRDRGAPVNPERRAAKRD